MKTFPAPSSFPARERRRRTTSLVERRIRLWASPHGAVKAAIAGAAGMSTLESFGENPAVLLDAQAKAGVKPLTTLEWQGRRPS